MVRVHGGVCLHQLPMATRELDVEALQALAAAMAGHEHAYAMAHVPEPSDEEDHRSSQHERSLQPARM